MCSSHSQCSFGERTLCLLLVAVGKRTTIGNDAKQSGRWWRRRRNRRGQRHRHRSPWSNGTRGESGRKGCCVCSVSRRSRRGRGLEAQSHNHLRSEPRTVRLSAAAAGGRSSLPEIGVIRCVCVGQKSCVPLDRKPARYVLDWNNWTHSSLRTTETSCSPKKRSWNSTSPLSQIEFG